MRVTFLGTNGWYDTVAGNTVCTLIEAEDKLVILDAGSGIHKLNRRVIDKPAYLFLSHFHLDHIIGMHSLCSMAFKKGLTIVGQEGSKKILDGVIGGPFTVSIPMLPFKAEVLELPRDWHRLPFLVDFKPLVHISPCIGYRFEIEGKTVTYCTDTGMCDNLVELAKDADLFITECSNRPGDTRASWPHLNPENALNAATLAGAKRLALMHFNAYLYPDVEERKAIGRSLQNGPMEVTIGIDDEWIEL